MKRTILGVFGKWCSAGVALVLLGMVSASSFAQQMGSMHVAFGDIPGPDMLNFLIAVQRAG